MAARGEKAGAPAHPKGLVAEVRQALEHESGRALVPAAFLAFAVLDAIPTPTDAGYFATEKWLSDHQHEIPANRFWLYQAANYYGWDVLWYTTLFGVTYYGGETAWDKLKIGTGVVATGAVASLLYRYANPSATDRPRTLPAPPANGQVAENGPRLIAGLAPRSITRAGASVR
jgi:hypothetical protein